MSEHILLVEKTSEWKSEYPPYPVVAASDYLTNSEWANRKGLRVVNLCRNSGYLGIGYYCSLLAEARGHRVVPDIRTFNDLSRKAFYGHDLEELDRRVRRVLGRRKSGLETTRFEIVIVFGECRVSELAGFARELFIAFRAPLMKVVFERTHHWRIEAVRPVTPGQLDPANRDLFFDALQTYLGKPWRRPRTRKAPRYDLAILHDPDEAMPPSNRQALARFIKAGKAAGIAVELITRKDFGRLAEFDALFIRETTSVNDHTYRFSRRAQSEDMVVMDDPESILRCSNKIYLAELLTSNGVAAPKTAIVRPENLNELENSLNYPMVLKVPDGSFSRGVIKVEDREELDAGVKRLFNQTELVLAQEFVPTQFDWRVGVLNGEALFVCQYGMSPGHWQIINHNSGGQSPREGDHRTISVEDAPPKVVKTAIRAARLIGDGLYGVDLKETAKGVLVVEVNDNPNIDVGVEDQFLGDALYQRIISEFVRRLDQSRHAVRSGPANAS
ncbi:MAG: RimK family protein [Gammaproteobacteria bacterium]|nr:RimK family protein [Gammaproteobacteria bacterium]MCP5135590.1 RimK family protein [Gammaproteobacteria bacterium]